MSCGELECERFSRRTELEVSQLANVPDFIR